MDIVIGSFLYLLALCGFILFGRFLKECDERIRGR